jgi:hypothetical protein
MIDPKDMLSRMTALEAEIERAKRSEVVVGLPKGEATSKVYEDGQTVVEVGASHEYGVGNVPERSFLRVPFQVGKDRMDKATLDSWQFVIEGKLSSGDALERMGIEARNISVDAFSNDGYGTWPELAPETVEAKGSSRILFDNGILRGSITWEVRGAS